MENAFIFPNGNIIVTTKLLENAASDNELAFILCHEIGHFYYKHSIKRLGRGLMLALAVASFPSLQGGSEIIALLNQAAELNFSRQQEHQADIFALKCLNNKYGHVKGYDTFFTRPKMSESLEKIHKATKYMLTHPLNDERIAAMAKEIKKLGLKTN